MAALVANSIILRVEIGGFCASALSHIVQRHLVQLICVTKVEVKPDDVALIEITLKDRCSVIVSHFSKYQIPLITARSGIYITAIMGVSQYTGPVPYMYSYNSFSHRGQRVKISHLWL